jgi:hypothetical protein
VQPVVACLLDRGGKEPRSDAAAPPRLRDQHSDLTDTEPGGLDVQPADDVAGGNGDDRAVDRGCEQLRPRVDVDRRLRCDSVELLGDGREELRERPRVLGPPRPYLERRQPVRLRRTCGACCPSAA